MWVRSSEIKRDQASSTEIHALLSELQVLMSYDVLVMQRVTIGWVRRDLRFQGSGLSCRAGARKGRESWEVVRALVKITFPYEPRRWG